jgi:putative flavoprotein involved in K+ transport
MPHTIVIGAGQAGLAMSWHLSALRSEHLVLERGRVGERWLSERWSSLSLLTPNWLNRLPGSGPHDDPDGFLSRSALVSYLADYAGSFDAPVEEGVAVTSVDRAPGGFAVDTSHGVHYARAVVIATGDCGTPFVPASAAFVPESVAQLHTSDYQSPEALPPGGVLVVGGGPSGQQLGLELRRAGREVTLSVGRHARLPRRYRGRDIFGWLALIGDLDRTIGEVADAQAARRSPTVPLIGGTGTVNLDLGVLRDAGVRIAGRLQGFSGGRALFARDLQANVVEAEERMRRVLERIDARVGSGASPVDVIAPVGLPEGPGSLDLRAAGIGVVLWATGYRQAYPWLKLPVVGQDGELVHRRGVTAVPGLYALGLRFQHRRSSHFIGGVGDDAAYLAARIVGSADRPYVASAA